MNTKEAKREVLLISKTKISEYLVSKSTNLSY